MGFWFRKIYCTSDASLALSIELGPAGTPAGSFDTLRFNNLGKRLTRQRASDGISTPVRAFLSPVGVCATPRAYRVGYLVLVNSLTDLSHVHSPGVQPSSRGRVTPTWMPFS
jgi:hypothetical protein